MNNNIRYLRLLLLPFSAIAGFWLNRQRGTATESRFMRLPKLVIYLGFAAIDLAAASAIIVDVWSDWFSAIYVSLAAFVALWVTSIIGFAPTWGELFMRTDIDTSKEDHAAGVKPITDRIVGYSHTSQLYNESPDKVIEWKTTGMSVRWMLYFAPQTLLYCVLVLSPIPLLRFIPLWFVGRIYKWAFARKAHPVEEAEEYVGLMLKSCDAALLLAGAFLTPIIIETFNLI